LHFHILTIISIIFSIAMRKQVIYFVLIIGFIGSSSKVVHLKAMEDVLWVTQELACGF